MPADNRAYGTRACRFLGTKLGGRGKVVMLQGDLPGPAKEHR
ncbi:hypothetical protein ACFO1B_18305 [Dactylosporangium siamense]|nr:hypothetical protein [Dactylosporangium siamense]